MSTVIVATSAIVLAVTSAFAHRVDEYLQATTISVGRDRVQAQIRLVPGVEIFPRVRALIDTDLDGAISDAEQRAYALRVLRDLTVEVDGDRLALQLVSSTFPAIDEMRDGRGAILIDFEGTIPSGGSDRRLGLENRHASDIAAYLVNGLVPRDPEITVRGQSRNYLQSSYQMEYTQAGAVSRTGAFSVWPGAFGLALASVVLSASVVLVGRNAQRRRLRASR